MERVLSEINLPKANWYYCDGDKPTKSLDQNVKRLIFDSIMKRLR